MKPQIKQIANHSTLIDLQHLDRTEVIATCLLENDGRFALLDPGPESCLENLTKSLDSLGLTVKDLDMILLTHIHLDHAGSTGAIFRENPALKVYVHEKGTPHLTDPSRLMKSAVRVFGSELKKLWGDFQSVPANHITSLRGGETLLLGKRKLNVIHTPGHASHHISYLDESTGVAFVGDAAGIRLSNRDCILPVTPPPEIDLVLWKESIQKIQEWYPELLFLTHFGLASPVKDHFDSLIESFQKWSDKIRRQLSEPGDDEQHACEFLSWLRKDVVKQTGESQAIRYETAIASKMSWFGLARYLRKKD